MFPFAKKSIERIKLKLNKIKQQTLTKKNPQKTKKTGKTNCLQEELQRERGPGRLFIVFPMYSLTVILKKKKKKVTPLPKTQLHWEYN